MDSDDPNLPSSEAAAEPAVRRPEGLTDGAVEALLGLARSGTSPGAAGWEPPSPPQLQPSFPQYEIVKMLGRGGMGAVYQGWQKSLDRFVAIKILAPGFEDGGKVHFDERFIREAKALAQLKHPGIVAVYDAGETADGLRYFVMEYVEGVDLHDHVAAQGRLEMDQALAITAHVCGALTYAHGHGIVHRDIKPANVMIDREGQVKVGDFGLARRAEDRAGKLTVSNLAIGTPDFAAPESFTAEVEVDQRADLYSVGVMLYQMLTGVIPRGRFDPPSTVIPGLDRRLDAIVDKAMQTDREKRYSTALEMQAEVTRVASEESATGGAEVTPAAGRRWKKLGFGMVLAAALFGAGALGFVWWKNDRAATSVGRPVAREPAGRIDLRAVTIDWPFVNSLGMKFVPVPIAGSARSAAGGRVLFSVWETRVQDFAVFASEKSIAWPEPDFFQGPTHPAVNLTWHQAQAFCVWLTERERRAGRIGADERYRLPTDHEWSCAVGLGEREDPAQTPEQKRAKIADFFPWGNTWPPRDGAGNYSGEEAFGHETWKDQKILTGYRDEFPATAPVGSAPANSLGLFDLGGNVWEWCEDRFNPAEPARVLRGASFDNSDRGSLSSSFRDRHLPADGFNNRGFRVVVSSVPPAATPAANPERAPR